MVFHHRSGMLLLVLLFLFLVAPSTAATGTIQINVHPGGGTVCLGTVCKANPSTADDTGRAIFENVETGQYYMVNIYNVEGYKPYLKQIYLDPLNPALTRDITLEPVPAASPGTGSVRVFVTPDGGKVCLDRMCEVSRGDRTGSWCVEFTDVSASTYHTLTVTNEGYETWTSQVRLLPGQASTISVTLQAPAPGSTPAPVSVTSAPPAPKPTQADLMGILVIPAVGICRAVLIRRAGK